jgi:hydrogenase maturation protease
LTQRVVLGVGNLLLKDDGVGVHVVQKLMERVLPPDVEVIDGGTAAIDLLHFIAGTKRLIVVDALRGGGAPGTIYRLTPEDLEVRREGRGVTLHQSDLLDVLEMAARLGERPPTVIIIGVEPGEIDYGLDLSPGVAGRIPDIIDLVLSEL